MDKTQMHLLQNFLVKTLGSPAIKLVPDGKNPNAALMQVQSKTLARIVVDDEDGERSYALTMPVPAARAELEAYLRTAFENPKLRIVPRAKKTDSVELHAGAEFIGVLSADDLRANSFTLEMAILDIDLEEV